jgi:hypothetical protein
MRRTIAQLVLLVIAIGIFAPALLAAQLDLDAHACCRRGGAHHCSMGSSATPGFHAAAARCPYRCATFAGPGATLFAPPKPVASAGLLVSAVLVAHAESAAISLAVHTPETRGPPSSSLL